MGIHLPRVEQVQCNTLQLNSHAPLLFLVTWPYIQSSLSTCRAGRHGNSSAPRRTGSVQHAATEFPCASIVLGDLALYTILPVNLPCWKAWEFICPASNRFSATRCN